MVVIRESGSATPRLRGRAASNTTTSSSRRARTKERIAAATAVIAMAFSASVFFQSAKMLDWKKGGDPSHLPEHLLRDFLASGSTTGTNQTSPPPLLMSDQQQQQRHSEEEPSSEWLGCLSDDCIRRVARGLARAFPPRRDRSSWCHPPATTMHNNNNTTHSNNNNKNKNRGVRFDGLLLTKVPKAASSTSAGVVLRLAHRHGCANAPHWRHRPAAEYAASRRQQQRQRQPQPSFLLTTVRDPGQRALSTVFFHRVSRAAPDRAAAAAASDAFLLRHLESDNDHLHYGAVAPATSGFQLRYAMLPEETAAATTTTSNATAAAAATAWNPTDPERVQDPAAIAALVRRVVRSYDFILVPERMDESLVALALTLRVDVGDVLVASSKVAGGSGNSSSGSSSFHLLHPRRDRFECVPTMRSFASAAVQAHLASPAWRALNYGDYLLHAAAHASLDRTIAQYSGSGNNGTSSSSSPFGAALARYRRLRTLERERCPAPNFPCSAAGELQIELAARDCYLKHHDFGCGYPCIDALLRAEDGGGGGG